MKKYISDTVKFVVNKKYDFYVNFDIEKYSEYLTKEIIDDISMYKQNDLISPHIYKLSYMFLTNEIGFSDRLILEYLVKEKNLNVMKMEKQRYIGLSSEVDKIIDDSKKYTQLQVRKKDKTTSDKNNIKNKNSKTNENINWDIDEYELIRGDWYSIRV